MPTAWRVKETCPQCGDDSDVWMFIPPSGTIILWDSKYRHVSMSADGELETTSSGPAPRRSAVGGVFARSLYVFGGVDANGCHFADIWRLDLDDGVWYRLSDDDLPAVRLPGVARIDGTFYLFGGRGGDVRFFDTTWAMGNNALRTLTVDGPKPAPRYGHSQVAANGDMYVFGGLRKRRENYQLHGDLWRFSPNDRRWTHLSDGGPSARYGAAMVAHDDELVLFGGRYLAEEWWYSDATWSYDLKSEEWSRIATDTAPSPRYTPGVVGTSDAMYVYGGMVSRYEPLDTPFVRRLNRFLSSLPVRNAVFPTFKPSVFHCDFWRFDFSERSWRRVAAEVGVPPLKTPIMGVYDDSFVIGFGSNLHEHYGRVWKVPREE